MTVVACTIVMVCIADTVPLTPTLVIRIILISKLYVVHERATTAKGSGALEINAVTIIELVCYSATDRSRDPAYIWSLLGCG